MAIAVKTERADPGNRMYVTAWRFVPAKDVPSAQLAPDEILFDDESRLPKEFLSRPHLFYVENGRLKLSYIKRKQIDQKPLFDKFKR